MSLMKEYEELAKIIGQEKYDAIDLYLNLICPQKNYDLFFKECSKIYELPDDIWNEKLLELKDKYKVVFLSDILYKSKDWEKFDKWYREDYSHKKIVVKDFWKSEHDDFRCYANIYRDKKHIADVIVSMDREEIKNIFGSDSKPTNDNMPMIFKSYIYRNYDKFINLPKLSKCSKLLQEIYDFVCDSESTMCHITEEDWNNFYTENYNDNDITRLKEEVKKFGLEEVVTFDDDEYKIIGWGNLETSFNDDRNINTKIKEYKDKETR